MPLHNQTDREILIKRATLVLGPFLFLLVLVFYHPVPEKPTVGAAAAVAVFMGFWWLTESVPLAVTSLLPIILFPLLGIATPAETTSRYFNPIISLFLGAFLIAIAIQRWNLHRRIALFVVNRVGSRPQQLVLGFLLASTGLSMWISNTATASMMLPIGLAVIARTEEALGRDKAHGLSVVLLLAIAYGASLGGVATLVGTPANLAFVQIFHETFPKAPAINFSQWFLVGLPYAAFMLVIVWWILSGRLRKMKGAVLDATLIREEYRALGPMSRDERWVLGLFASAAVLWMSRKGLSLGGFSIPGWSDTWPPLRRVDDGTIAVFLALVLFVIPASDRSRGRFLLEADAVGRLPWGILLLFGGGFALAHGFVSTGLSGTLAAYFSGIDALPHWMVIALICLAITFLTELTSNTATTQMFLPVLAALALAQDANPLLYMIPATISASMAFMMPVATPPNAIVFGSQRLKVREMARIGLLINLIGVVATTAAVRFLVPVVFGTGDGTAPVWAGS